MPTTRHTQWYVCYFCQRDSIALEHWDTPDGPFRNIGAAVAYLTLTEKWSDEIVKVEIVPRELLAVSVR